MLGAEKGTLVRWGRCWWCKNKCLDKGPRKDIGNTPAIVADEIQQTYGNATLTYTDTQVAAVSTAVSYLHVQTCW